GREARRSLRTAMTRLALVIHAQGPGVTRLEAEEWEEVLTEPQAGAPDRLGRPWGPEPSFWWDTAAKRAGGPGGPYYWEPFERQDVRPLTEYSLVRQDESVGFLHDSFLSYFVGVLALREWHGPGSPPRDGKGRPVPDEWAQAVVRRMRARPTHWVQSAE